MCRGFCCTDVHHVEHGLTKHRLGLCEGPEFRQQAVREDVRKRARQITWRCTMISG